MWYRLLKCQKKIEEKPAQDDLDIFNPMLISNTKKPQWIIAIFWPPHMFIFLVYFSAYRNAWLCAFVEIMGNKWHERFEIESLKISLFYLGINTMIFK